MIVVGIKGEAEIWYNEQDENGNANFVKYELDHSDNHQQVLKRI